MRTKIIKTIALSFTMGLMWALYFMSSYEVSQFYATDAVNQLSDNFTYTGIRTQGSIGIVMFMGYIIVMAVLVMMGASVWVTKNK